MCLKPQPLQPIPDDTFQLVDSRLPTINLYRQIGDKLADFDNYLDFVELYPAKGQPAFSPALLVLVTILQRVEC
ncbi:MAG TPA: hypothetical protein VH186_11835 [Chloroflexia bacterium]|nr:hypothetical protein [Chloroflexia bacterium]